MKENKTIHVISTVTLVTLFAKLLGIVRESLQARTFGTQIAADLYTTANNNTIYLFTTAAYALCIAAVPILTPRLRRDRKAGYAAANNLITVSVLLSAIVAAVWTGATFLPSLAGSLWEGGVEESLQLAGYMRVMILTLPVIVLTYLLVALFQSLEHFVLQGSMSIPYNLALIAFLAVFAGRLGVGGYVAAVAGHDLPLRPQGALPLPAGAEPPGGLRGLLSQDRPGDGADHVHLPLLLPPGLLHDRLPGGQPGERLLLRG